MTVKNMLARGTVVLVDALKKMQSLQMRLTAGELKDNAEHFEPYGFTSNLLAGAEVLTAFIGGDRSHAVVLVAADRRYRIQSMKPGEVAIYTDEGDKIHFKRGRIIDIETGTLNIKATTAVNFETPVINQTGQIVSVGDQLAGGISQINHVHTGVQAGSGQSGAPAAGMMLTQPSVESALIRAVVISLYTWRRADTDDPVDDDQLYGWWGDSYPAIADDRIGSRLWLLRRVKLTDATQRDAEFYAAEALRWLIDDGHVLDVSISSNRADTNRLNLGVVLTIADGTRLEIPSTPTWQVIYAV